MQVDVYNKSDIDFEGTFRDKPIHIPAKGSIKMGRAEANKFIGEWSPMVVDGAGRHLKPKSLEIREDPEARAERLGQPLKFQSVDGKEFRTTQGLEAYEGKLKADAKGVEDAKPRRRRRVIEPDAAQSVAG